MGSSGDDLMLSPAAQRVFPFAVECKCVEKLSIWSAIDQATKRLKKGRVPLIVASKNRLNEPTVVLPFAWLYGVQTNDHVIVDHHCMMTCGGTDSLLATLSDLNHCRLRDDGLLDVGGTPMHVYMKKTFPFWSTVEQYKGIPIIFNRGDPNHTIYVTLPWSTFVAAVRDYHDTFIAAQPQDEAAAAAPPIAQDPHPVTAVADVGPTHDNGAHGTNVPDSTMGD